MLVSTPDVEYKPIWISHECNLAFEFDPDLGQIKLAIYILVLCYFVNFLLFFVSFHLIQSYACC